MQAPVLLGKLDPCQREHDDVLEDWDQVKKNEESLCSNMDGPTTVTLSDVS